MSESKKSDTKAIANWDEDLARYAKAEAERERPQLARISLKGGVMTYMDQKIAGNKMAAIVLATMVEHAWYPNRFNPAKPEAPDCFAFSEDGEDMVPHEKSFNVQARTCNTCPQFQWGSDKNSPSRKGKACKEKRKLLIMPAKAIEEKNIKRAELAIIDVPVMSVRNWKNYVNEIAASYQRPSWGMVTEIMVEPDAKAQFVVRFSPAFTIANEHLQEVYERAEQCRELLTIPYEKTAEGLSPRTEAMQTGAKY